MAQAYITNIHTKETTYGKMYDFEFSDGNKVGAGKFMPKGFAIGDYVNYEYDQKGNYKNLRSGSLSKLAKPAGVAAPAPSAGKQYVSNDKRQETISKQAALNSALAYVTLLHNSGALPIPASAKTDKKADLVLELVNEFTCKFYKQSTGEDLNLEASEAGGIAEAEADTNWQE